MLPSPNLDDRRFQDLVDESKRFVQRRCPEWSDHNVSDPGVTLIETFAYVVDQLMYRLNRVPDKNYLAFLDLIGVQLFPPTAARADVTLLLSSPQEETVLIPAGTEVATTRTETEDAVVFSTARQLPIVPCAFSCLVTASHDGEPFDRTEEVIDGRDVPCFSAAPAEGDVLLVGLSEAVPSCAVVLRLDSDVEGVGVDPRQPPLVWEAWDGADWTACEVDRDETGGLNRPGQVVLHVPPTHAVSVVARRRAGWLRCRAVQPEPGQPFYSASPTVRAVTAFTIGGTVQAFNTKAVNNEDLGVCEGVPGQRFTVSRPPVIPSGEPFVVEVAADNGWQAWTEVDSFAESGPTDRHIRLDHTTGEVAFPPAVREPDGSLRHYGAVPPKGAPVRVVRYHNGGGRRGNVARGAIRVLRSSVPYVAQVENRRPALGGTDGEDIENAKVRGPMTLRTRDRAITVEDYEYLAQQAAPGAARVRCVPAGQGAEEGGVRVLVVPHVVEVGDGEIRFADLVPPDDMLAAISRRLDVCRPIGARICVEPPFYQGITVVAQLQARAHVRQERLRIQALAALYSYFNPLTGGAEGTGWPFGRPVQAGEVFAVLQRLPGVELVEDVRLFPADPLTGERGAPVPKVVLDPHALVYSFEHQVRLVGT
ncbi:putative phage baseplate assembly protein [Streptomyces sp. SLBN-118]|nr:putative phage baseplate assembly protein [Streptomyces sp. SLBN-118]